LDAQPRVDTEEKELKWFRIPCGRGGARQVTPLWVEYNTGYWSDQHGKDMIQGSVSLLNETNKTGTVVVKGMHKKFKEWVDMMKEQKVVPKSVVVGITQVNLPTKFLRLGTV